MRYTFGRGNIIVKAFSQLLHFIAICIIVVSPIVIGLTCNHNNSLKQHAFKHIHVTQISEFSNGFHNTVWNIFKNRHLSAPPSNLRVRTIAAINLIFISVIILIQTRLLITSGCYNRYHTKAFAIKHKYILNSILLI